VVDNAGLKKLTLHLAEKRRRQAAAAKPGRAKPGRAERSRV
jgi:hypothetical protein